MSVSGAVREQKRPRFGSSQTLYRFYDSDGELLYIGISADPGGRFKQHRGEKSWWTLVARIELEHYETRMAVCKAERDAVREEMPPFNIQLKGGRGARGAVISMRLHRKLKALDDKGRETMADSNMTYSGRWAPQNTNPAGNAVIRWYVHVDFNDIEAGCSVVALAAGPPILEVGDMVVAYEEGGPRCDGVVVDVFDRGRGLLARIKLDRETWVDA